MFNYDKILLKFITTVIPSRGIKYKQSIKLSGCFASSVVGGDVAVLVVGFVIVIGEQMARAGAPGETQQ